MEKLHVITCISNPVRYQSRYKLYKEFEKYMLSNKNVELWTIEMAYGDRDFEITESTNDHHVQVRSREEIWHKENMLNILIKKLPLDWKYVAWIDADVVFSRPDWAEETVHQLQHYSVVQLFSEAVDLDDKYYMINASSMPGMIYQYYNSDSDIFGSEYTKRTGHCGYAWAARRDAIEVLGGLLDFSILGSGDWQMACAFFGKMNVAIGNAMYHPDYVKKLMNYQNNALKLRQNIGYVDGLLLHNWHGAKSARGYNNRWKILEDSQFNPNDDLEVDLYGLYRLKDDGTDRYIKLRDDIRTYFRSRDEDNKRQR